MNRKGVISDKPDPPPPITQLGIIFLGLITFLYCFFSEKHNYNENPTHVHNFFCFPANLSELAAFVTGAPAHVSLTLLWLLLWGFLSMVFYVIREEFR